LSRHKGDVAEQKAVDFLNENGFFVIEQNFYARKMGEIDIIAKKDDIYHFIEVKSGTGFEPIYNISHSKLSKLLKSVHYYLKLKNLDVAYSIDVVTIQDGEIDFLENITL
jgi:putative endonuclease